MKVDGSIDDLKEGFSVWVDVIDPDEKELENLSQKFSLNKMLFKPALTNQKSQKFVN